MSSKRHPSSQSQRALRYPSTSASLDPDQGKAAFACLVNDFCMLWNLDHPESLLRGEAISIDGVLCSLRYDARVNPQLVFAYCDFGELPEERVVDVFRVLLEANFQLHVRSGPIFTVSPETGHVLLVKGYRLGEMTPKKLRAELIKYTKRAKAWQIHYFLEEGRAAKTYDSAIRSALRNRLVKTGS